MDEINRARDHQQSGDKADENLLPTIPKAPINPELQQTQTANQQASSKNQSHVSRWTRLKERLKEVSFPEWLMIIFTGVIAFSTVAYAVYAKRQWDVMTGGSSQTERLITAANRIANSMKDTVAQSKRVLDQTIETSRLDQRAWLTVSHFRLTAEPETGKPVHIDYFIQNTGKTPALDYYSQAVFFLASGVPKMRKLEQPKAVISRAIVPPESTNIASATSPTILAELELSHYRSGRDSLFLHAILRYRDIYDRPHWTTVCAYHTYGNPLDMFQFCANGNEVDRDAQNQK